MNWSHQGRTWGWVAGSEAQAMAAWADYAACYAGFLGLQLLDLMVTLSVLGAGGGEANPLAHSLLVNGQATLLGMKLAVILLSMAVWVPAVAWLARQPAPTQRWALPTLNALVLALVVYYAGVVFYNMTNLAVLHAWNH